MQMISWQSIFPNEMLWSDCEISCNSVVSYRTFAPLTINNDACHSDLGKFPEVVTVQYGTDFSITFCADTFSEKLLLGTFLKSFDRITNPNDASHECNEAPRENMNKLVRNHRVCTVRYYCNNGCAFRRLFRSHRFTSAKIYLCDLWPQQNRSGQFLNPP